MTKNEETLIRSYLENNHKNYKLFTYDTVASTNTLAKEFILKGLNDNLIIIAKSQTNGRGRYGKKFFSPENKGIYISFVMDFKNIENRIPVVTSYIALAVCKAIKKVCSQNPKIKWVNDIYINNKKVAGILTETSYDYTNEKNKSIVIGIGINISVKHNEFPDELKDIAASLCSEEEKINRSLLICSLIDSILMIKDENFNMDFYSEYIKYSMMINKKIMFTKNNKNIMATVINIDKNYNLIVKDDNNNIEILSSGQTILLK